MYLLEGLKAPPVARLKLTRKSLSEIEPRALEAWQQLEERLCSHPNYSLLRDSIQTQLSHHQEVVVPWLKLIEKDIVDLEVLNDFFFQEDIPLLNFEKMYGLANHKRIVINSQKSNYIFNIEEENQNNKILQNLMDSLIVLSEEDLHHYSYICEED